MKYRIGRFIMFLILFYWVCISLTNANPIEGKIVAKNSKEAIANADIFLIPVGEKQEGNAEKPEIDFNIIHLKADADGNFAFVPEFERFLLCSTNSQKKNIVSPVSPWFNCSKNNAKLIETKKLESFNLGDIEASFNFQEVILYLENSNKTVLLNETVASPLFIKFTNKKAGVFNNISKINLLNTENPSLSFYLPEGNWEIEIGLKENGKNWSCPLVVEINGTNKSSILTQEVYFQTKCSDKKLTAFEAKKELGRLKIDYNLTSLESAIKQGDINTVKLFLKSEFNIKVLLEENNTLLTFAIEYPEIVKLLIKDGINVNQQNFDDNTALHFAVVQKSLESTRLLLKAGAKVNIWNSQCETPLILAITEDDLKMVKLLLKYNAKQELKGSNHCISAIETAKKLNRHEIIELLNSAKPSKNP